MKLNGSNTPKGEFLYRALFSIEGSATGWELSEHYYQSIESVKSYVYTHYPDVKYLWPVEEIAPGVIYIPTEDELLEN